MEDFIPSEELSRERGYYLVTLHSALLAIQGLEMGQIEFPPVGLPS